MKIAMNTGYPIATCVTEIVSCVASYVTPWLPEAGSTLPSPSKSSSIGPVNTAVFSEIPAPSVSQSSVIVDDQFRSHKTNSEPYSVQSSTETPIIPQPYSVMTESFAPSSTIVSTSASTEPTAVSKIARSTNKGAIAGGVVGSLLGVTLLAALIYLYVRHRRRARSAPSAEFMAVATATVSSSTTKTHATTRESRLPLTRQDSLESETPPPPFTPGTYTDPVYEKVRVAKAERRRYRDRDRSRHWGGEKYAYKETNGADAGASEGIRLQRIPEKPAAKSERSFLIE